MRTDLSCYFVVSNQVRLMRVQAPLLDLLVKHMDAKGKQAKLKSPQELQELLDVTRELLADMDRERQSAAQMGGPDGPDGPGGPPNLTELKLDADQDELREKFGIVRVSLALGQRWQDRTSLHAVLPLLLQIRAWCVLWYGCLSGVGQKPLLTCRHGRFLICTLYYAAAV